jgi:transcriptional regulator GlxA family with amidase domain
MKIQVFVFDGADELDFVAPLEIFRRVAERIPGIDVALVTAESTDLVTTGHGLKLLPDGASDGPADLALVPGGGYVANASHGVRREIERGVLGRAARALHDRGAVVAGVCTGAMVLAAAGMLDNRPATTHHSAIEDLRRTAALVHTHRVVDDGDILTCGGITSGLDLAFWVVERQWGAEMARDVARFMEYTPSRDIYLGKRGNGSGQPPVRVA